jgi:hypothetical protein
MRKLIIVGALGATMAATGTYAVAQSGQMPGGMMGRGMGMMMGRMSPEDMSAFADAHIAALRAGLKLSTEQEKLWPPVEEALRGFAQLHLTHMRTMMGGGTRTDDDPVATLRAMADRMGQGASAASRLAEAAAPLYATLDDAQKRRLRVLVRDMGPPGMMGRGGRGLMRGWFGNRDDDDDER